MTAPAKDEEVKDNGMPVHYLDSGLKENNNIDDDDDYYDYEDDKFVESHNFLTI